MTSNWDSDDEAAVPEAPQREVHLAEYWALLLKHWKLIMACGVVAVGASFVKSLTTKPAYRAIAVLNIEKERGNPMDLESLDQPYAGYDPTFIPTQMRLIESREIAEAVVRKLRLLEDPAVTPKRSGAVRQASGPSASPTQDAVARAAVTIQNAIDVKPVKGTSLIELSCVAPSSKLAAEIVNAVAESYIEWNLDAKFRLVGQASQFLDSQIEQLKSELDSRQDQLLAYGRRKDIISVDPRTNVTLQKLETLNKDYADAVGDRVTKEARYNEVKDSSAESVAEGASGGLVTQLRNDQAKLERDYAEKLNLFKPEWPAMLQLKAQIDQGRLRLATATGEVANRAREAARSEYQTALRRESSLRGVLESQKSEAMVLSSNAVEYNNLNVEIDTKRTLLDNLLKRKAETEVMSRLRGERVSNVRVVERALPPTGRFSPSYRRNAMTGAFIGGFVGVALTFLLGFLDRSLKTSEQVEDYLKLPTLGVIPAVGAAAHRPSRVRALAFGDKASEQEDKAGIELLPHEQPRSTAAEAYRLFRAGLLLSSAGGVKSIVVTSAVPEEGKTATACNLAIVLGQLGKRVLLVDGDLHKPRVHQVFGLPNKVGLVSILAERVESAQVITKTQAPGVFVVPAGPSSPNPSGLLSSEWMRKFMELAEMNFDFVVIDAPPVLAVADPLVIGSLCDGAVICIRAGKTPRERVARARDLLMRSHVRILGVVINGLSRDATAYGQSYSYHYYRVDSRDSVEGGESRGIPKARTV